MRGQRPIFFDGYVHFESILAVAEAQDAHAG
jgi:hypothetical protein